MLQGNNSKLQEKYRELIDAARTGGVTNLQVSESGGVLHLAGDAPSAAVKDRLWNIYNRIDPNYLTGDLVMNVNIGMLAAGARLKVTTDASNLNIRKGPGTDEPVVGSAGHGEVVTLVSQPSDQWWVIRTSAGEEGYAYAQYLTPVS